MTHKESGLKRKATGVPFKKGDPRAGRPKGTTNHFTSLKDSFLEVFEKLGGTEGLLTWVKSGNRNKAEFYRMVTKMLPANVSVEAKVKADLGYEQAREIEKELEKEKAVDSK
jgi:hypothetical protein